MFKKQKERRKKIKNKKLKMELNEDNNLNNDIDPIVDNFKDDLNNFSFNDKNKKIRPTFSKKLLSKIERMELKNI